MGLVKLMTDAERAQEALWAEQKRATLENYRANKNGGEKRATARHMLDTMTLTQRRDALRKLAREARAEMQTLLQEEFETRKNSGDRHGNGN